MSVLTTFIDNHDVKRIWNLLMQKRADNEDSAKVLNILTYLYMSYGIPILYYATESKFNGGDDPLIRDLYDPFRHTPDPLIYKYIKILNEVRTMHQTYDFEPEFRH